MLPVQVSHVQGAPPGGLDLPLGGVELVNYYADPTAPGEGYYGVVAGVYTILGELRDCSGEKMKNSTVEPLYCGHLGDLVKCPVYSGTPLLWTPWGPGEVSCIQWNPSIVDTLGTW